jgi:hypothetical protein
MQSNQIDLFAQDNAERNKLSEAERAKVRDRLQETVSMLESASQLPWSDPLEVVHQENRFERDCQKLGEEGHNFWARFDRELDRLFKAQ